VIRNELEYKAALRRMEEDRAFAQRQPEALQGQGLTSCPQVSGRPILNATA
jgi:hypothetical protein